MFDRKGILAYCAILASCVAGGFGLSPWTIVASACVLMLISMSNHDGVIARLGGGATAQASAMMSTVLNAAWTSGAAFVVGMSIGYVWGLR
ncbi:MAG: hypothetical protein ABL898_07755 [Hyphomicrobiaceae bacterium]|nr:hypothetical protein [Hyphomicrobiaceae bacterium]